MDGGRIILRGAVCETAITGLGAFCHFHQRDDFGEEGFSCRCGDLDDERAGEAERAGMDGGTGSDCLRHAFPVDDRDVEIACAPFDGAIDRDAFAGSNRDAISGLHILDGAVFTCAVGQDDHGTSR
ncbi:hypothetical protein D3C80_838870 [compost metagenome]